MDGLKVYEATFKEDTEGVFSISLVEDPATQETFIALSKNKKIQLAEVDKEQRILMGLVLQPDQLIYRNQGGEEFNILFRSETIKELSQNFFKSGFQLNSKLEHEEKIEGISVVESWLVEDPKIDKSAAFGFSYPKGSWMVSMKVDSDEIWNDYVKTGKVKGFSVDALVNLKEINLKSNIKMAEEKNILEKIEDTIKKVLFSKDKETTEDKVELGSVTSGDITIEYDGEVLETGTVVFVTQNEERIALPDGEYETEMGMLVVVDGTVTEIKSAEVEAEAETTPEAAPSTDDQLTQAIKSLLIKYTEDIDTKLETLKTEFTKENDTLKEQVVELSNQPATPPIKSEVVQKSYTEMSNYEKLKFNRQN